MAGANGKPKTGEFTPTEQRMLAVLADGKFHRREELITCLNDAEYGDNVKIHISNIRKKIRLRGENIAFVPHDGGSYYQHIRFTSPGE